MKQARLPLWFDAARLRDELTTIAPGEWVEHFNKGGYEGDWSAIALRAVDGDSSHIAPDPTVRACVVDTPVLERMPYVREVLAAFQCPLTAVRLLKLGAKSDILEHRDYRLSPEDGEVRIHIPVVTNELVEFYLDGERVRMAEGETWFLDLGLPHRVKNNSTVDRVHLVIDCVLDDWLATLLRNEACANSDGSSDDSANHVVGCDEREFPLQPPPFADPTVSLIARFVQGVGIPVSAGSVTGDSVLPGISVERGWLVVDESRLRHPGDLLHEAGHLAVIGPTDRARVSGSTGTDPAEEMMAIAWSYAATMHLGIDPTVVFHPAGYRGGSDSLLQQFAEGRYLAVPMLQWLGMAYDADHALRHDAKPYPDAMRKWVRTSDEPDPPSLP